MPPTPYTLVIDLDDTTLKGLATSQYTLYGFRAFGAPPGSGATVWFQTSQLGERITLTWTDTYSAYTSHDTQAIAGGHITADNAFPLTQLSEKVGETLTVNQSTGLGTVAAGGTPGSVTVLNTTSTQLVCGLAQIQPPVPGATSPPATTPICAVELYGNNEVLLTPGAAVFLMFGTRPQLPVGQVVETSVGPGVLIPFSDATPSQTVSYDINNGWSGTGITKYPANTSMTILNVGTQPG